MRRALRWRGGVVLEKERMAPRPEGWARVAIELGGICRTDLYVAEGAIAVPEGRVIGHEVAGRVVEGPRAGERVAIWPYVSCGGCEEGALCLAPVQHGVGCDGLFADVVDVPASQLVSVGRLGAREAAFVEPVAAALAVLEADLPTGLGLVRGHGRIASLVRRVLASAGHAEGGTAWVVETDGDVSGAVAAVDPGGTVVLKSRPATEVGLDLAAVVTKQLTLRGARHVAPARAVGWLLEHEVADLFAPPVEVARWETAFAAARDDRDRKHFLRFGRA